MPNWYPTKYLFTNQPARQRNHWRYWAREKLLEKWEVERVEQVIDILGLVGRRSRQYPRHTRRIGEKTAKSLIKQYGSVEGIIAHADELKGKLQENVRQYAEQGLLSKRLATINLNTPVELDEAGLEMCAPSKSLLEPLFAELEFRTLGKRVFGDDFSITETRAVGVQTDLFSDTDYNRRTTIDS